MGLETGEAKFFSYLNMPHYSHRSWDSSRDFFKRHQSLPNKFGGFEGGLPAGIQFAGVIAATDSDLFFEQLALAVGSAMFR